MKKELIVCYERNYYKMEKVAVESKKDIIHVSEDQYWTTLWFIILFTIIGIAIWTVAC